MFVKVSCCVGSMIWNVVLKIFNDGMCVILVLLLLLQ